MRKNSPIIISVTGWSGSGKTTFSEKLITELASRGLNVAAAKNTHLKLQIDKPGSDSERFFKAGASSVCLNDRNNRTVFHHGSIENGSELLGIFPTADYIVAEGFKAEGCIRIEVTGLLNTIEEMKNPASEPDIIVYGTDVLAQSLEALSPELCGARLFNWDNVFETAEHILSL